MFRGSFLVAGFGLITFFSGAVFAASFDCRQASRPLDKRICADAAVSQADSQLAMVYQAAMQQTADKAALITAQRAWLKARATCADAACLLQRYQGRITVLQKGLASTHSSVKPTAAPSSASPAGAYPVWINPDLGVKSLAPQDIKAALARKFWDNPVYQREFNAGLVYLKANYQAQGLPTSCLDIIQLIKEKKYDMDGTVGNQHDVAADLSDAGLVTFYPDYSPLLNREETDCQAARLLQRVRPAARSAVQNFRFNNNFAAVMPALVVPNSFSCITDTDADDDPSPLYNNPRNQRKSWRQFYHYDKYYYYKIVSLTPTQVKLAFLSRGELYTPLRTLGTTTLQLLARGDFTGNGQESVVMAIQFHQNQIPTLDSEMVFSALFLLTRTQPGQVLEVQYPQNYMYIYGNHLVCDEKLFSLTD